MDFREGTLLFRSMVSITPKYVSNLSTSLHFYTTDTAQDFIICCWDYRISPLTSLSIYILALSSLFTTLSEEKIRLYYGANKNHSTSSHYF